MVAVKEGKRKDRCISTPQVVRLHNDGGGNLLLFLRAVVYL